MIKIHRSPSADTRTCDHTQVSKHELLRSSKMHIRDMQQAMAHLAWLVTVAGRDHDFDKVSDEGIAAFHKDFANGFTTTDWWDNHRKVNRHHLNAPDGVRDDVDLIDVLEHVADCVMAGAARSDKGTAGVYAIELPDELLQRALANTVEKLKAEVQVVDDNDAPVARCRFSQPHDEWRCHSSPGRCYHDAGTCVVCPHMQRPIGPCD